MTATAPARETRYTQTAELWMNLWRFSVEQYHAMIEAGVVAEDHPVELLGGYLVTKMPKNPPHSASTFRVRRTLEVLVPDGWFVESQEPVTLADSEPEPDAFVARGDGPYVERHLSPEDLALVVEVSAASLQRDRTLKKRLYAVGEIPFYWIVDLRHGLVEVFSYPADGEYRSQHKYASDAEIPLVIDGLEVGRIPAGSILP